tara:strand:- start:1627 stop:2265 length:639 start_codon:yes stop_codon:yes gene_type:complete
MSITNYTQLKSTIADFLARDDLTSQIPTFIQLAEGRMSRELETREQEKRATANLTANDQYITLPSDFREVREVKLNINPVKVLTYHSPTNLDQTYGTNGTGKPQGFSIVGAELKVRPIPDSAYQMEIIYIGTLPTISDSVTPILFSRSPELYLYGALSEAYIYLLDEQRASVYDQKFSRGLEEVKVDEQRSHYGTGSLQIKSVYSRQDSLVG